MNHPLNRAPRAFPYKIAVLCDLRDPQGRVLLIHRAKQPNEGLHSPIGGKLDTDRGESPAQCARREILEEAGIDVPIPDLRLAGIISERAYLGETNWLMFWYTVTTPVRLQPRTIREGRLDWHDWEAFDRLPLPETDRLIIWPLVHANERGFFAVHIDCESGTLHPILEAGIRPKEWPIEWTGVSSH